VLFIALILGHIYIGTLGMKGAFEAMGTGEVDYNWAKEHRSPKARVESPPGCSGDAARRVGSGRQACNAHQHAKQRRSNAQRRDTGGPDQHQPADAAKPSGLLHRMAGRH
jgi:hypothetical protein